MPGAFDPKPTAGIKSIQRGITGTNSVDIKISPVNMAKTEVTYLGFLIADATSTFGCYVALKDPTTLAVKIAGGSTVSWEVVERY